MAEQEQGKQSASSIRYIKGLFKDTSHIDQPSGTIRYAKNAILNRSLGAISNEEGNTLMASLPEYSTVIGTIPLTDNEIVVFLIVDDPTVAFGRRNEIGIYYNSNYDSLLRLPEVNADPTWSPVGRAFNFQISNPIEGEFIEQGDNDLVMYWTDDLNPPRTLNITRQKESPAPYIYGINPDTTINTDPICVLDLFPNTGPTPHVDSVHIHMGGDCKTGVYYLALGYKDDDFTSTNFVTVVNPVSIVPAPEGISPIDSYDGAPAGIPSGKTIRWKVSNINPDYRYLNAAVVFDIGEGRQARKLPEIEILDHHYNTVTEDYEIEVVFSGDRGSELFSVEDVVIDTVSYTHAKTITQLDGTLYLGNLRSKIDLGYQKYANFISLTSVVKSLNPFDPFQLSTANLQTKDSIFIHDRSQGYRDANNIFKYKGYTREEVYAFYIAFILKDGSMSYAYHIPGRAPLKDVPIADINELQPEIVGEWTGNSPISNIIDEDATLYGSSSTNWSIMNITGSAQNPISHFFQWYDFSAFGGNISTGFSNNMNFWNNLNEFYPDSEDFDVVDAENPNVAYDTLRKVNVRHHRFPSNNNPTRTTVLGSNAEDIASGANTGMKVTIYWSWFSYMRDCDSDGSGGAGVPDEASDFVKIWNFSETSLNEDSSASNLNDWDPHNRRMQFQNTPWENSTDTCFVPGNPMANPLSAEYYGAGLCGNDGPCWSWCSDCKEIERYDGAINPQTEMCYEYSLPGNFIETNQTGYFPGPPCLDVQEVEFKYNGYAPPQNQDVMVGWRRQLSGWGQTAESCGNIGYGRTTTAGSTSQSVIETTFDPPGASDSNGFPRKNADKRPGWVAWAVCTPILDESDPGLNLEHEVQALGFELGNVKIPKTIADQVQGFRIYHADRTHPNRTVLGQSPLHYMSPQKDSDTAGCVGEESTDVVVDRSEYWYPSGIPGHLYHDYNNFIPTTYSFHDFYLLNGRKNISSATHIKLQYVLDMFQFKGNTTFYSDEVEADPELSASGDGSCLEPQNYTAFFCSGNQNIPRNVILNCVIANKAKRFLNGGEWLKAKPFGFEKDIYNIGGESLLALKLAGPQFPFSLISHTGPDDPTGWQYGNFGLQPTNGDEISYYDYTEGIPNAPSNDRDKTGLQLHMANLKAFKTDIYDRFDVQDLIWTGYEVVGEAFNNFVVGETYKEGRADFQTSTITPEGIFGGDTFICRYGYRMTSREQRRDFNYFPSSRDLKSLVFVIVESTDNINFRHIENPDSMYFPGGSAADVLDVKADVDLSYAPDDETGNMKYNEAYSLVNNVKAVVPKPITEDVVEEHPARVIRSDKLQRDSIIDTYRIFRVDQYRELPTHKGELWKLVSSDNLLYFHMEDTLYRTKGKQKMKLGDGTDAYVGSGDLFAQDPDEIKMADTGYMGTRAQWASIVTPFGYFSVDVKTRKVFLAAGKAPVDLAALSFGLQRWLQENIPFALEAYGFDGMIDSPIEGMGFHAVWDERYSRVLLTKRDIIPTEYFIANYSGVFATTVDADTANASGIVWVNGSYYIPARGEGASWGELEITADNSQYFEQSGWTVSFTMDGTQGKGGSWTSFHDYVPYMYSTSGIDIFSFIQGESVAIDRGIYRHANASPLGRFYGTTYSFEVEIVHNLQSGQNKLFYSLNWLADVFEPQASGRRDIKDLNAGFTSFILYNSSANSGKLDLEYLINTRKTGGSWKVNQFRDMSVEIDDPSIYYTGPIGGFSGSNYGIVNTTVAGTSPAPVPTSASLAMFNVEGMNEVLNTAYIDTAKPWNERGKFIDRFLAFRLICNNLDNNLINLYNTEALYRIQLR